MCEERLDDVFENLPTLDDLVDEMLEEDRITLAVSVVENLLEQIRVAKEELNDYHIRDAEMEGWMSIPRNRYLRLLGLELENRDLIQRNEHMVDILGEESDGPREYIVQPPEDCENEALFNGDGCGNSAVFDSSVPSGVAFSHTPAMWRNTVALEEKDIEEVVAEVMRRIGRRE